MRIKENLVPFLPLQTSFKKVTVYALLLFIIITWTDCDILEVVPSYLTVKKIKMENKSAEDWIHLWIDGGKKALPFYASLVDIFLSWIKAWCTLHK